LYGIKYLGGSSDISLSQKKPLLCFTIFGKKKEEFNAVDALDIVQINPIGMLASNIIADIKKEEICARFSNTFYDSIHFDINKFTFLDILEKCDKSKIAYAHDLSSGGIFEGLWDMSVAMGSGFCVDINKILINQASVEICELYDLNPYMLESTGAFLLVVAKGDTFVNELRDMGIRCEVLGRITDGNQKVLMNKEEIRYLDTPKQDDIYKLL